VTPQRGFANKDFPHIHIVVFTRREVSNMKKQQQESGKRLRSTPEDLAVTSQPLPSQEATDTATATAKATDSTDPQSVVLNPLQSVLPGGEQGAEFWISQVLESFNWIYSEIRLPLDLHLYVNALVGASGGKSDWFELTDREVGIRMRGDMEDGNSPDALKKRVYRLRKKLIEWQQAHNYVLVEVDVGYANALRDEKTGEVILNPDGTPALEFHKTRYRLPVLPHAKQILLEAFSNPKLRGDISLTAKRLMALLQAEPKQWDSAGRYDEARQLRGYRSRGITNIKKAIELVRKQGDDPRYFFEAVFEEIEEKAILPIE
jgi:hypothetical protein